MFFDTHAHYDDDQFDDDRETLLATLPQKGVSLVVDPGSNLASSKKALNIAELHDFIFAAVGIHPHDAKEWNENSEKELRLLANHKKTVAIGEIGLDYHYDFSPRDVQRDVFRRQLGLARSLKMPVIVHEREACEHCLSIIKDFPDVLGVIHCFSGSLETAKIIVDMGWYISFTGAVTFKNARKAPEVAAWLPEDRLMIETDSPYMAPVPVRGTRNDSSNLTYIAEKIAALRGITSEEVARITMENGKRFFNI